MVNPGTPVSRELWLDLPAQQGRGVSMNYIVPSDGQLRIQVTLPDGSTNETERVLKTESDSMDKRIAVQKTDGTWELYWVDVNSTLPTVTTAEFDPGFMAWKQQQIAQGNLSVADPANFNTAVADYQTSLYPTGTTTSARQVGSDEISIYVRILTMILQSDGSLPPELRAAQYLVANSDAMTALANLPADQAAKVLAALQEIESPVGKLRIVLDAMSASLAVVDIGGSGVHTVASGDFDVIDVGGQPLVFGSLLTTLAQQLQSCSLTFYWNAALRAKELSFGVHKELAAGRVFLGMLAAYTDSVLPPQLLASGVSHLLGIPSENLLSVPCTQDGMSAEVLRTVFAQAGYDYLFEGELLLPVPPAVVDLRTHLSRDGRTIILTLDTASSFPYATGEVYVRNGQNQRVSSTPIRTFTDTLNVDISAQRIADLYGGAIHGDFVLEVVLKDASDQPFSGDLLTNQVRVDTLQQGLSALPDTPENRERRDIENAILQRFNEPVRPDPARNLGPWTYRVDSPFHVKSDHGRDSQYFEVDLNLGMRNDDDGQHVYAAAEGTVESTPSDSHSAYNTVTLRHTINVTLQDGTRQTIAWYTQYLHMDDIQIQTGQTVDSETYIGEVSNAGWEVVTPEGTADVSLRMTTHLHFDAFYVYSGVTYRLDLELWLAHLNIPPQ